MLRFSLVLCAVFLCSCSATNQINDSMDITYQRAHDPIRVQNAKVIAALVMEYASATGRVPLQDLSESENAPFMALIGHSVEEEDRFAQVEALNRGAMFVNSGYLEKVLSEGLKRNVSLPRDPQTVATYAPNVYVYFYDKGQFCSVAHLFEPSDKSVKYSWEGGDFYSHALCYSRK